MSQATLPGRYRNSNLFSGYYLDERVFGLDEWDCDEEAEQSFEELQALYDAEQGTLESYDEDPLRRHWIDEVLSILGYEPLPETPILDARGSIDRALYDSGDDRRAAAAMKDDGEYAGIYGQSLSVLEAKQWDADFTERFGEARSYRDASHQIKYYLEHTPESISWGILTNGKQWRLYGTKDYETETYYEVDLVDLLETGSVEVFSIFTCSSGRPPFGNRRGRRFSTGCGPKAKAPRRNSAKTSRTTCSRRYGFSARGSSRPIDWTSTPRTRNGLPT